MVSIPKNLSASFQENLNKTGLTGLIEVADTNKIVITNERLIIYKKVDGITELQALSNTIAKYDVSKFKDHVEPVILLLTLSNPNNVIAKAKGENQDFIMKLIRLITALGFNSDGQFKEMRNMLEVAIKSKVGENNFLKSEVGTFRVTNRCIVCRNENIYRGIFREEDNFFKELSTPNAKKVYVDQSNIIKKILSGQTKIQVNPRPHPYKGNSLMKHKDAELAVQQAYRQRLINFTDPNIINKAVKPILVDFYHNTMNLTITVEDLVPNVSGAFKVVFPDGSDGRVEFGPNGSLEKLDLFLADRGFFS